MKILVISNLYPSAKDKVYGTFVKNFYLDICSKNKSGINDLIAIKGRRKSKTSTIGAYIHFYIKTLFDLAFRNYDLIYVHTITFPIIPIRIAMIIKHLPIVFNVHGGDVLVHNKIANILKMLAKPILPKAKLVVCPSEYFKGIVKSEFPNVPDNKIFVSPSGGIAPYFFKEKNNRDNENDEMVVGYVSRIDPGKGWNLLLQAAAKLMNEDCKIRIIIIGRGSQEQELKESIRGLGLSDVVKYVGPIKYEELPLWYQKFDILAFPTMERESLGLVGLEAMAASVPVITSNIGAQSHYVIDGQNGYLFKSGDASDLYNALKRYLNSTMADKNKLSHEAYKTALNYEATSISEKLYTKLLSLMQ